ncbi:cytochrome P450 [Pilobolus umbonatus]|nr:cytochrome P450 [Pilobolus umbonatus]
MNELIDKYKPVADYVIDILQQGSPKSYIGAAIVCVLSHKIYSFLSVPKELQDFPKVSFLSMLNSYWNKETSNDRTKRLIIPLLDKKNGFYVNKKPLSWTIFVTDPMAAKLLLLKSENFPKSQDFINSVNRGTPVIQFMGNDNVAISNGEKWKGQRRIMNPAFHRSMPAKTFGSIVPNLFSLIDKQNGDNVPVTKWIKGLTLDILGITTFGFDFQSLEGDPEGWTSTYDKVIDSLFDPWMNIFARFDFITRRISTKRRESEYALHRFNKMLDGLIDKRRTEILDGLKSDVPDNEKDLLTLILEADIEHRGLTSTEEIRHNIALFFLAGHDTTAHSITFCLYYLAKNKDVQAKAREEVLRIFGDEPVDVFPTLEELSQLEYINQVIKETLRMNSPLKAFLTRKTKKDVVLANTLIPKESYITIDVQAMHTDPRIWSDPYTFNPDRFAEGGEYEKHKGFTWLPFSNGSRQCIGMNFSLTEQRIVLSMLLRKYEIDIPEGSVHSDDIQYDMPLNLAPANLMLNFTKRY